jgi:hypothetical protein
MNIGYTYANTMPFYIRILASEDIDKQGEVLEPTATHKRSEVLIHATHRETLKDIVPSKINHTQKAAYAMMPLKSNVQNRQIHAKSGLVVARDWGKEE